MKVKILVNSTTETEDVTMAVPPVKSHPPHSYPYHPPPSSRPSLPTPHPSPLPIPAHHSLPPSVKPPHHVPSTIQSKTPRISGLLMAKTLPSTVRDPILKPTATVTGIPHPG